MSTAVNTLARGASAAARFRPRIILRATNWAAYRTRDITIVVRYGVLPDGSEISLGRTVDRNLAEATKQYWGRLYLAGFCSWMPCRALAFRAFSRWYPVEIQGYEMTPRPPKERE